MGENNNNGDRRVIRVNVEPVEIELDDDDALLICSLQSAIPGASGLYFNKEDCKTSIKFDGKKLLPPTGGWQDRKYFATLGARPFDYPYGSYANASKQFERSVDAVQRLLGGSKAFDYSAVEREISYTKKKTPAYAISVASDVEKAENMKNLLASISKQGSASPQEQGSKLTPIEQQFVDLARISTAKDTIIEQQRIDNRGLQEKLDAKERELKNALEDLSKIEKRCAAQEEELNILRNLSKEQTYMCEKVNELTKKFVESESIISQQRGEIDDLLKRAAEYEVERKESSKRISEMASALEVAKDTIDELESQLSSLKPLADLRQIKSDDEVLSYFQMSEALSSLKERNEKLENEMNSVDEKYEQLNQLYNEIVAENTELVSRCRRHDEQTLSGTEREVHLGAESSDFKDEKEALKSELAASENKIAELTKMIQALTKEATNSERRAEEAILSRNEMRRSLDLAETKIQITITR